MKSNTQTYSKTQLTIESTQVSISVNKDKGSPYSITERRVPESGADPGSWQSACMWRES